MNSDSTIRQQKGAKLERRLFVSTRAHLVFDFHQIVDGLKEAELGGGNIGTTRKGIGPTYSAKASRSGLRVHHLLGDWDNFSTKFQTAVGNKKRRYGEFEYSANAELAKLKVGISVCMRGDDTAEMVAACLKWHFIKFTCRCPVCRPWFRG